VPALEFTKSERLVSVLRLVVRSDALVVEHALTASISAAAINP